LLPGTELERGQLAIEELEVRNVLVTQLATIEDGLRLVIDPSTQPVDGVESSGGSVAQTC
jgi:hypothetical protein